MTRISTTALVGAVLITFMERKGLSAWQGTEEDLYRELTAFKDDDKNTPDILRAMAKLERLRDEVIKP